ncbi:MAG TPA: hypothetical protein VJA94_22225 [Candidatus Angelobacter sp.]
MDWKLIFGLSLFGVAMAIATVFVIPSTVEPFFWLVIFVVVAFVIAQSRPDRAFAHGLLVGIVNSIWITCAHVVFFDQYIAKHAKEAAMMQSMPASPRVMMAIIGPVVGVITGIVIGVVAVLVVRMLKTPAGKSA